MSYEHPTAMTGYLTEHAGRTLYRVMSERQLLTYASRKRAAMIALVYLWPNGLVVGYDELSTEVFRNDGTGIADHVFARATTATRYPRVRLDNGLCEKPSWEFDLQCKP